MLHCVAKEAAKRIKETASISWQFLLSPVKFHAVGYFPVCLSAVLLHRLRRDVEGKSRFHAAFPPHVALAQAKRLVGRQVKRLDPCDSPLGCHALQHGPDLLVLLIHPALRRLADRLAAG